MSEMTTTNFEEYVAMKDQRAEAVIPVEGMEGIEIRVRRRLTLEEMYAFVDGVCKSCVSAEGEYYPESYQYALDESLLRYYTDCELPDDATSVYALMYEARDLVKQIKGEIDRNQYQDILIAIERKIEHEVRMAENAVAMSMQRLMAKIEGVSNRLEGVFEGIDNDTMTGIVKTLGAMDESKLAKALNKEQEEAKAGKVIAIPKKG